MTRTMGQRGQIYALGKRAMHVYEALQDRIQNGIYAPGSRLPAHMALAEEFEVAPLTVRNALARLEKDGMILREQGRGTFVQTHSARAVLIVDDEPAERALLAAHVIRAGFRMIEAADADSALNMLVHDRGIALILSDVRMPRAADGISFIGIARARWPAVPLAVITGFPDDLAGLHTRADAPVLVLAKPVRAAQLEEVFRLTLDRSRT